MAKYSEDIHITHPNFNNIQLKCGYEKHRRFIRYELNEIVTEYEVIDLARREYSVGRLPCDHIYLDCTHDELPRSCEWEYNINHDNFNLTKIL